MSHNSGDESSATNGEGFSAQEGLSGGQFVGITPERRLQELQVEMERLGEAPVWFELVESALEVYDVPREFWGLLVFPLVAERVPYLSTRLNPAQHRDYSVIKETVLDELKLSADQLQKNLSEEARRYIPLQEGRKWVNAPEMTGFLRTFEEGTVRSVSCDQAEITVLRESAIAPETVQPRGRVNLTSAFGERVQAKLAVVPLAMSREGVVTAEVARMAMGNTLTAVSNRHRRRKRSAMACRSVATSKALFRGTRPWGDT
ncbi:hypothetical protein HPB50_029525 [Hyalomma asiaticum]|nr:hypothetical protein HPB50_029525 [Hyalomma asiaticum]